MQNEAKKIDISGILFDVPVKYSGVSAHMVLFPISLEKASQYIKNPRIKPVSILGGKTLLAITIFDYLECQAGPYREVAISIPVLLDAKISIPLLPLILDQQFKKMGYYAILLGMNTDISRAHSEIIFGYPTYKENLSIDVKNTSDNVFQINVKDKDDIFSINCRYSKKYKRKNKTFNTYFKNNNSIQKVIMDATFEEFQGNKNIHLELGDHEISNMIKSFSIEPYSVKSLMYRNATEILQEPVNLN